MTDSPASAPAQPFAVQQITRSLGILSLTVALSGVAIVGAVVAPSLRESLRPTPPAAAPVSENAIRDYLLAHGDVIQQSMLGNQQRMAAAQAEKAKQMLATHAAEIYADPTDVVLGNPNGDVAVVEFYDPECPYCLSLAPDIDRLVAADKNVKVVLKAYPILGPMSQTAAKAELAALKQGMVKAQAFHHGIMAAKTKEHTLTEELLFGFAATAGLDIARLKADMAAPEIAAKLAATFALARELGVNGTPGVIIAGKLLAGTPSYEALLQQLALARTAGRG